MAKHSLAWTRGYVIGLKGEPFPIGADPEKADPPQDMIDGWEEGNDRRIGFDKQKAAEKVGQYQ